MFFGPSSMFNFFRTFRFWKTTEGVALRMASAELLRRNCHITRSSSRRRDPTVALRGWVRGRSG